MAMSELDHERLPQELAHVDASVAIIDFGGQLTGNIDRVVREHGVRSEIVPYDVAYEGLSKVNAYIFSGGPDSVYDPHAPKCDPELLNDHKPKLLICYGMGLAVEHFGGTMELLSRREDGPRDIVHNKSNVLFGDTPSEQSVWMSHGDGLVQAPEGFDVIATSSGQAAAIANHERRIFGTQFHPEADHTQFGEAIIDNFLFKGAELLPDFTLEDQMQEAKDYIRQHVGDEGVRLLLSGGVDSSTMAALMADMGIDYEAFLFDTGLLRKHEVDQIRDNYQQAGIKVTVLDLADKFFNGMTEIDGKTIGPLYKVTDPEEKRFIVGDTFMDQEESIMHNGSNGVTRKKAQGSIRPDKIETGHTSKTSATIKTHHNASPKAKKRVDAGDIIEPLQHLYKPQVRAMAEALGLPSVIVKRKPSPGPGEAIRIMCDPPMTTEDWNDIIRIQDQLDNFLPRKVGAKVLAQKTVGVQGDNRSYKNIVGLPSTVSWEDAQEMAQEIPDHIHGVNRVVSLFDTSNIRALSPPTHTRVTPETVAIVQEADYIANTMLEESGYTDGIAQFPVILSYMNFGMSNRRSIALRPFITKDFMTGRPAIPGEDLPEELVNQMVGRIITEVSGISKVMLDLSTKPPGTTEWE